MTSRFLLLATLLLCGLMMPPAHADTEDSCHTTTDLGHASQSCVKSGSETNDYIATHSAHTYSIRPACEIGGNTLCHVPAECNIDGHHGSLYNAYEDAEVEPLPWQACLTDDEAVRLGALTPGLVLRAFQRLSWPASPLVVQPPKGRTLVNFDTNFYTTNTRPTRQTVTLVGRRVTIEATPTQYTWHFDGARADGTDDLTTRDPGAPYPDLRITHRYTRVGTVAPSVDTTYAGRYRVGNGPWRGIPDTLTVPGAAIDLRVVSATPHLVGY